MPAPEITKQELLAQFAPRTVLTDALRRTHIAAGAEKRALGFLVCRVGVGLTTVRVNDAPLTRRSKPSHTALRFPLAEAARNPYLQTEHVASLCAVILATVIPEDTIEVATAQNLDLYRQIRLGCPHILGCVLLKIRDTQSGLADRSDNLQLFYGDPDGTHHVSTRLYLEQNAGKIIPNHIPRIDKLYP